MIYRVDPDHPEISGSTVGGNADNGWYNQLSPDGSYIAFGNLGVWIHEFSTGKTRGPLRNYGTPAAETDRWQMGWANASHVCISTQTGQWTRTMQYLDVAAYLSGADEASCQTESNFDPGTIPGWTGRTVPTTSGTPITMAMWPANTIWRNNTRLTLFDGQPPALSEPFETSWTLSPAGDGSFSPFDLATRWADGPNAGLPKYPIEGGATFIQHTQYHYAYRRALGDLPLGWPTVIRKHVDDSVVRIVGTPRLTSDWRWNGNIFSDPDNPDDVYHFSSSGGYPVLNMPDGTDVYGVRGEGGLYVTFQPEDSTAPARIMVWTCLYDGAAIGPNQAGRRLEAGAEFQTLGVPILIGRPLETWWQGGPGVIVYGVYQVGTNFICMNDGWRIAGYHGGFGYLTADDVPYDTPLSVPMLSQEALEALAAEGELGKLLTEPVVPLYQKAAKGITAQLGLMEEDILYNLALLCTNVLQPVKDKYPDMIVVSGFRQVNTGKSQHETGEAADIQLRNQTPERLYEVAEYIAKCLQFDQVILTYTPEGRSWIHVSFSADSLRRSVLTRDLDDTFHDGLYLIEPLMGEERAVAEREAAATLTDIDDILSKQISREQKAAQRTVSGDPLIPDLAPTAPRVNATATAATANTVIDQTDLGVGGQYPKQPVGPIIDGPDPISGGL